MRKGNDMSISAQCLTTKIPNSIINKNRIRKVGVENVQHQHQAGLKDLPVIK